MKSTTDWMLLDCSFLVYRAQYAMREHADAVIGFLATVQSLRERFDCDQFVFCFDVGKLKRCELLPSYKERKRDPTREEEHRQAKEAMNKLRCKILPDMGFKNVVSQEGYEADDLIAECVLHSIPPEETSVIVSSDADLFQLLRDNVTFFNPNKDQIITDVSFESEWGLIPMEWWEVKAISGCNSDNIKGVRGVGEATAAKYLRGELGDHTAAFEKIVTMNQEDYGLRKKLVQLPFEGTKPIQLEKDSPNWRRVQSYGSVYRGES